MSFIRPELTAALWRQRETLAGLVILLVGLWWTFGGGLFLMVTGAPVVVLGAAIARTGWQRARFRHTGDGPGIVEITEARIAYFGPLTGGAVAVAGIDEIALDPRGTPLHWRLTDRHGRALHIPVTAAGSDGLLDAFAQLPGFRTEPMLKCLRQPGSAVTVLWSRGTGSPDIGELQLH